MPDTVATVVPLFMATLFNNSVSSRRAQMEVEKLLQLASVAFLPVLSVCLEVKIYFLDARCRFIRIRGSTVLNVVAQVGVNDIHAIMWPQL